MVVIIETGGKGRTRFVAMKSTAVAVTECSAASTELERRERESRSLALEKAYVHGIVTAQIFHFVIAYMQRWTKHDEI